MFAFRFCVDLCLLNRVDLCLLSRVDLCIDLFVCTAIVCALLVVLVVVAINCSRSSSIGSSKSVFKPCLVQDPQLALGNNYTATRGQPRKPTVVTEDENPQE